MYILVKNSKLLILDIVNHPGNSDYSNLYDEYSNTFQELKGIPPQHDIEHCIDLLDP